MSIILTNASVVLGNATTSGGDVDISAYTARVALTEAKDEHDDTVMGMNAHSRVGGLITWSVRAELNQEFASTGAVNVDKVLHDLLVNQTLVTVKVRPFNAARSSDNPEYSGPARLFTHNPMDGAVGDLLKTPPEFRSAGSISRLTSSS